MTCARSGPILFLMPTHTTPSAPITPITPARAAFNMYGGTPYSWDSLGCDAWWTAAVLRFETWPTSGQCKGERFFNCLRAIRSNGFISWREMSGECRAHWQKIASTLTPWVMS